MHLVYILATAVAVSADLQCGHGTVNIPSDWIDMVSPCVNAMKGQIREELKAAIQYMAMGAHFSKDTVNRPGFANMFFESASEERGHAIKLIDYLLMRGELTSSVSNLIKKNLDAPPKTTWRTGVDALKDALILEASVTKKIRKVIEVCENPQTPTNFNDYHLVDYLTGVFLEEQHKGQRDLAGKVSNLEKMMDKHGELGEWLFDKKLQGGEA